MATTNESGSRIAQRGAGEVDPEVAERALATTDDAADDRHGHRHAGGGRHEVLHGQAEHLGQVAHRQLGAVPLPVRVGHEADGHVERAERGDGRHVRRVERQGGLEPLQCVDGEERQEAERQQGDGVDVPPLLASGVDAQHAVDHPLDGCEEPITRRAGVGAGAVHRRHVATERRRGQGEDGEQGEELDEAGPGHQNFSGRTSTTTR